MFHIIATVAKMAVGAAMVVSPHAHAAAEQTHVVQSGETLWGISAPQNHDWRHLYSINRNKISDPDVIYPGQVLNMSGQAETATTDAKAVVTAPAQDHSGKVWGKTYGYPYKCGDGDSDGWDMPCVKPHAASTVSTVRHAAATASSISHSFAAPSSAGVYSFAGLEALWTSAGGPAWAASAAASVAECESGGRVNAYNPSGATGLWQILGSVVSGNLDNPYTNALNAVSKFKASGNTWAQWVCKPLLIECQDSVNNAVETGNLVSTR